MNKTFSHLVNFNVQSLALNKDGNKLLAAGVSDWELFTIEESRFVSNFILNPKAVHHRIFDIGWSRLDQRLVASCGSNGLIQKLIVTPTELRLENTYRFHELTVSKIHFHPSEQNLLISGGQDGNIKLIDFRVPLLNAEVLSTFRHHHEDKVTDLQFNPHSSDKFASGSESGFIYIWDRRNLNEPEKRYSLFRNISHLDWHPEEKNCLAVSRVDRQISILDTSTEKVNVRYYLTNPESISNIKWRPDRRMQIGACMSAGTNYHLKYLYVWDLTRPYVPYASFDSVINKANNFLWRNSDCIIASAKAESVNGIAQSTIYNAFMCDTLRPANYVTLVSIEMDKNGSLAFANGIGCEQNEAIDADITTVLSDYPNSEKFLINRSNVFFLDEPNITQTDWFRHAATNYRFNNGTFDELCDHNAQVALDFKRVDDYKNWMILKTLYNKTENFDLKEDNSSKSTSSMGNSKQLYSTNKTHLNDNNSTIQIPFSQVTAIENVSSSLNDSEDDSSSSREILSGDSPIIESNGNPILANFDSNNPNNLKLKEVSDKLNNYHHTDSFFTSINNEIDNNDIQENNIMLNNSYLTKNEEEDDYSMHVKENGDFQNIGDLVGFLKKSERENEFVDNDDQQLTFYPSNFKSQSDLTMSLAQSAKLLDSKDQKVNVTTNNTSSNLEINKIFDLNTLVQNNNELENALKINFDERFCELLFSYVNEKNDIVTALFMFLIAIQHEKIDNTKIDSFYLDEWLIQYIDLLAKYELWNQKIEILKKINVCLNFLSDSEFLRNHAQKAHSYTTMCASCKITIKPGTQICKECNKNAFLCSYCHLPVKRLYAWCNICCHGGHMKHMMKWFETNTNCPTGCGCICSPDYLKLEQNVFN